MIYFLHWILRKIKAIIRERFSKTRREKTTAELVLLIFIAVFVISFLKIPNNMLIRYLDLIFIQVYAVLNIWRHHKKIKMMPRVLYVVFSLMVFVMLVLSLISGMMTESIIKTLSILDLLVMSFTLLPTALNKMEIRDFFRIISNGVLAVTVVAAAIFNNDYLLSMDPNRLGWNLRFVAGFQYPSCLGYFSFIVFAVSVYELFSFLKKHKFAMEKCWPNILKIIVVLVLMYLSNTRTAQFVSAFFVLFIIYDNLKSVRVRQIIRQVTLMAIAGVVLLLIFNGDFYNFFDNFLSYRLSFAVDAVKNLAENNGWLTGVGAFRNSSMEGLGITVIDNGYLNFVYQYGVIALVLLMMFLGIVYRNVKVGKGEEKYGLVYYFYVAFLVYAFFENDLLTISNLMAVIVYTACGMRINRLRKGEIK